MRLILLNNTSQRHFYQTQCWKGLRCGSTSATPWPRPRTSISTNSMLTPTQTHHAAINAQSKVLLEAARMLSGSTLRSQETQQQQQQKQQQQEQKEQEEKQDVRKSLSKRQQLKLAVRDYGATVMVFHITISLASLGICYAAISSGIDMVALLQYAPIIGEKMATSELSANASTFVVAYAVHKCFAPVRISITLGSAPFIVRSLRAKGWLKTPAAPLAAATEEAKK